MGVNFCNTLMNFSIDYAKYLFCFRMQKDLASLGNLMQDPKSLRESVAIMVKKFAKSAETAAAASIEEDTENKKALEEILRQKAFLERWGRILFSTHFR